MTPPSTDTAPGSQTAGDETTGPSATTGDDSLTSGPPGDPTTGRDPEDPGSDTDGDTDTDGDMDTDMDMDTDAGSTSTTGSTSATGSTSTTGTAVVLEECGTPGAVPLLGVDNQLQTWVVTLDIDSSVAVADVVSDIQVDYTMPVGPAPLPTTNDLGDLSIVLRHGANAVVLYDGLCDAVDVLDQVFEDGEASADCTALADGGGTDPAEALSLFDGEDANGVWRLEFTEPVALGVGPSIDACVRVTEQ